MKRLLEPAFSESNFHLSMRIIWPGVIWITFFVFPIPPNFIEYEMHAGMADADARLRDTAWQRMRQACFTEKEIRDYWYDQGFWEHPRQLIVIVKGREALCGGRGQCGCKAKVKTKDSV